MSSPALGPASEHTSSVSSEVRLTLPDTVQTAASSQLARSPRRS